MLYCPELEEVAAPRLFHSEHNFGSSYSVSWLQENDERARQVLKKLRIRPAFGTTFEVVDGDHLDVQRIGGPVVHCLITSGAHRKLLSMDVTALRTLLD